LAADGPAAEDGYNLWLRYAPVANDLGAHYARLIRNVVVEGTTPTANAVRAELARAMRSIVGRSVAVGTRDINDNSLIVGTPSNSAAVRSLRWDADLAAAGREGFVIRATHVGRHPVLAIASTGEAGALYGAFHLLRLMQAEQRIDRLNVAERPKLQLRLLNHWDNLDGTIERGYAGNSLWQWNDLPDTQSPRYVDYARANASIGINGAVINNVNADARILSADYLSKVAALAAIWRPYGVRLYLSANFAAPIRIGGLTTADPLDRSVRVWWQAKADEIYAIIPDFGGFLVKANSEGQPGPKDYNRSHAEGANAIADALAPHGGHVIWRAFVYDEDVDPDRAKRAYIEFMRLDGKFKPNALVQVKNGPIDFQPREPFHPLFGAMKETPVLAEVQATQEYLGQAKHLVYLGTMWKEFLDSDTYANGRGSTVAKALEGAIHPSRVTGFVAVTNPGLDANWCGHHFSQANWYAAGRLAWNPELSAGQIADEWTRQTFTNDPAAVRIIRDIMMRSHEIYVSYTMPLGLHHLIGGTHYAPMPQNARAARADQTAVYYHRASEDGIGFDRSTKGDGAVDQYFPPVRDLFDDVATCPETLLLWFHRCRWDYKLASGKMLWDGLCEKYFEGAREAAVLQVAWRSLANVIDSRRHKEVDDRLSIQVADATKWRDQVLQYFQQFSKREVRSSAP
jgi:alpha-glucuronidase